MQQEEMNQDNGTRVATIAATDKASERIRAELNIEKWPAIWKPAKSKSAPVVRVLERETQLTEGGTVKARVEIGFTHLGELTTEDQKTYYALVKQWEVSGRPDAQTFFSVRGVARFLQKHWGTNVIDAITESLRRLRATPFTWENAYHDGQSQDVIEEIDMFNILSELKIVRKKTDGHITHEAGYFRFNDFTLKNLEANHTKPVLLDTILGFRSEVAQLLYGHIDLILATKPRYERKSRELLAEIGLKNKEYSRIYERRRVLERALVELRGAQLSTGVVKKAEIERTRDGKDYKVVFEKGYARSAKKAAVAEEGSVEWKKPALPAASAAAVSAASLVRFFHQHFYGIEKVYPQSKEIEQATCLIARHGLEQAKFIVQFSLQAAEKTGYLPQTFGGILQYTSRALHAFEAQRKRKDATGGPTNSVASTARQKDIREAEVVLKELPPEKFAALRTQAIAEITTRLPWLARYEGKPAFEAMVRGQVVADFISSQGGGRDVPPEGVHEV